MIRYIGKSSNGAIRIYQHRSKPVTDKTYCAHWIRNLKAKGLRFEWAILEITPDKSSLPELEVWWISYGRLSGWPLTNLSEGGVGGNTRPRSTTLKRHMSRRMKGRKVSQETRDRLKALAVERWKDPAQRKMASDRAREHWEDPKAREQVKIRMKTYMANPAAREVSRQAALRQWQNPETRRRFTGNNSPSKRPEVRAKIGAAQKRVHLKKRLTQLGKSQS